MMHSQMSLLAGADSQSVWIYAAGGVVVDLLRIAEGEPSSHVVPAYGFQTLLPSKNGAAATPASVS